ncbi:MAG: DNA translocase FtsK [Gammaproteobacteria bacterium]
MAQATRKKSPAASVTRPPHRGLREAILILLTVVGVYLLVALATYNPADPSWSHSGSAGPVRNYGGVAGAWFADVFLSGFGYLAYLFPVMAVYSGWLVYQDRLRSAGFDGRLLLLRWVGFLLTVGAGCGLATLHFGHTPVPLPLDAGGILGDLITHLLVRLFGYLGASLLLLALFLGGVTLFTGLSWLALMDRTGRYLLDGLDWLQHRLSRLRAEWATRRVRRDRERERDGEIQQERAQVHARGRPRIEPVVPRIEPSLRVERERQVPLFEAQDSELPPLALLDPPEPNPDGYSTEALEVMSRQVEGKLRDFGVEVTVESVHPGPVITRFELQPAPGVKVSQISNLAKDVARALSAVSVRVVEVIPGKSVVGLEIPNEAREQVSLGEILRSEEYDHAPSPLTLALGKDIGGRPVVADLTRMPHLLVAGTTGSGKSVALNAMLLSLLYKATAQQVRLILIDPKMLELSVYEGVPHLLTPVVTDMKEAANALRWCVAEMERRYQLMSKLGVRNIAGYNRKVQEAIERKEPIPDPLFEASPLEGAPAPPTLEPLPYIVVLIDEFADMMMVVGKKVEELIARLAQKARASGIHLILATQRPSVDVITGLIKANIPTRIAFQVSSKVDSRTILDQMGAEQLLGHGDMLYLPPGTGLPVRVHGAYVADHEVHKVVEQLRRKGAPEYYEEILQDREELGAAGAEANGGELDPLYDQAVRIVTESRRASISGVQRRLKIGYNRAARMIEEMERTGVVGPLQSNGAREVLAGSPPED